MKFQVYEHLPQSLRGHASKYEPIYTGAIDAACENEPHLIRVDELAGKSSTVSSRSTKLKQAADAYAKRTGLTGFRVKQRTVDGQSYPFICKVPNGGAS